MSAKAIYVTLVSQAGEVRQLLQDGCIVRIIRSLTHPPFSKRGIMAVTAQETLEYHRRGRPGKIEVTPTKPMLTQRDLSLAYTPGVADVVLELERTPATAYK